MLHAQPSIRLPSYLTFSVGKSFLDKTKNSGIFFRLPFFPFPLLRLQLFYVRFALLQPAVLSSQRTRREPNSKVRDKSETKKKKEKKGEELLHRCNIGYITYFS